MKVRGKKSPVGHGAVVVEEASAVAVAAEVVGIDEDEVLRWSILRRSSPARRPEVAEMVFAEVGKSAVEDVDYWECRRRRCAFPEGIQNDEIVDVEIEVGR